MQKAFANVGSDYVFAKLHARWSQAVYGDRLRRLVDDGTPEALARTLAPLGIDARDRTEVQRQLTRLLLEEMAHVRALLDERTGAFCSALIGRYHLDNLKTVLTYRYGPEPEQEPRLERQPTG